VKNFIGTLTTEILFAEFNVTPLKSQTDFTSPFSSVKGKIQQKYFNGKYPYTIHYKYLKQKKVGGCLDLIFGVNDTAETDFGDFRSDYLGEYDAICKTFLSPVNQRHIWG
jgi:hypothetical protein